MNILRLRLTTDCQPRTKNGQPHQSTTGVASANSTHVQILAETRRWSGIKGSSPETISKSIGTDRATLIQNRRLISANSGFFSLAVNSRGSSVMPQMGQFPGSGARFGDASDRCTVYGS